jgi:uridine phosphorylase
MDYPIFKSKCTNPSLFTPKDFWHYKKMSGDAPSFKLTGAILLYASTLLTNVLNTYKTTKRTGILGESYTLDEFNGNPAVIGGFGIGAPGAAIVLEECIALGAKSIISVGIAGSLQKTVDIGDIVVCDKAIRDEGTSYHYKEPSLYSYAAPDMVKALCTGLDSHNLKYKVGSSWTTDAPYRETAAEIVYFQKKDVLTVEMEAATIFTVGEYKNVNVGAAFVISDSLADLVWNPQFDHTKIDEKLHILFHVAATVLSEME